MLITFSLLFGLFVFGLYYIYYSWMEYDEFIASPTPVEIGVTAAYMAHFFPALFMYARSAGIFLENNKNAWHSRREKERRKE
jgi:hypothetical protein